MMSQPLSALPTLKGTRAAHDLAGAFFGTVPGWGPSKNKVPLDALGDEDDVGRRHVEQVFGEKKGERRKGTRTVLVVAGAELVSTVPPVRPPWVRKLRLVGTGTAQGA
jgi:hypothetical protein